MSVCTACGSNDELPLGRCVKCGVGEQADPEADQLGALRAKVSRLEAEIKAAREATGVASPSMTLLEAITDLREQFDEQTATLIKFHGGMPW